MNLRQPRLRTIAITTGLLVVSGLVLFSAASAANDDGHTICHATGSESNPYVMITPSVEGVYNGHFAYDGHPGSEHLGDDHQEGEDIIPPFTYNDTVYSQNWDEAGQAIFDNECEAAETTSSSSSTTTGSETTTTSDTDTTTTDTDTTTSDTDTETTPIPVFPTSVSLIVGALAALGGTFAILRRKL